MVLRLKTVYSKRHGSPLSPEDEVTIKRKGEQRRVKFDRWVFAGQSPSVTLRFLHGWGTMMNRRLGWMRRCWEICLPRFKGPMLLCQGCWTHIPIFARRKCNPYLLHGGTEWRGTFTHAKRMPLKWFPQKNWRDKREKNVCCVKQGLYTWCFVSWHCSPHLEAVKKAQKRHKTNWIHYWLQSEHTRGPLPTEHHSRPF